MKKSEYLEFVEFETHSRKTRGWEVRSVNSHALLGTIAWYPAWRQYVIWPETQTLFNHECLTRIAAFLFQRNRDHAEALRVAKERRK
jgi:hypothetical protein